MCQLVRLRGTQTAQTAHCALLWLELLLCIMNHLVLALHCPTYLNCPLYYSIKSTHSTFLIYTVPGSARVIHCGVLYSILLESTAVLPSTKNIIKPLKRLNSPLHSVHIESNFDQKANILSTSQLPSYKLKWILSQTMTENLEFGDRSYLH